MVFISLASAAVHTGYHSDVGGGNGGLSSIALYWMYAHAQELGVGLDATSVEVTKRERDPQAECKTAGMDRIADNKRTI